MPEFTTTPTSKDGLEYSDPQKKEFREQWGVPEADNEGIEEVDGKLKLKDRDDYKIIKSDFDFSVISIDYANSFWEIRYDFDMGNMDITIPYGVVLVFMGGSFTNFSKLIGNNTGIISPNRLIFSYNRATQYISGTWSINEWNASWFGITGDGACNLQQDTNIFTGTDNYDGLQKMLDTAYIAYPKNCFIPDGKYRVSEGLNIGWGIYTNISVKGAGRTMYPEAQFGGTYLYCEGEYGISINGGRGVKVYDMSVFGINYSYRKTRGTAEVYGLNAEGLTDINNWVSSEVKSKYLENGMSRYCPYGGIITDGYSLGNEAIPANRYSSPTFPAFSVQTDMYPILASSRTQLDNLMVSGFVVGIGNSVGVYDDNDDFNSLRNSVIDKNVYGFVTCNSQARNVLIDTCSLTNSFYSADAVSFGTGMGHFGGTITNTDFGGSFHLFNLTTPYAGTMLIGSCYCEAAIDLGFMHSDSVSEKRSLISFLNCEFKLLVGVVMMRDYGLDASIYGFANFSGCKVTRDAGLGLIRMDVTNIGFRVENSQFGYGGSDVDKNWNFPYFPLCDSQTLGAYFIDDNNTNAINLFDLSKPITSLSQVETLVEGRVLQSRRGSNFAVNHNTVTNVVALLNTNINIPYLNEDSIGDIVVSKRFAGIITSTDANGVFVKLTNGYKYDSDLSEYSLIADSTAVNDIVVFTSSKQRMIGQNILVTEVIAKNQIIVSAWDASFVVGRQLDFFDSYPNNPMNYKYNDGKISVIDEATKTITFSRDIAFNIGDTISGYLLNNTDADFDILAGLTD